MSKIDLSGLASKTFRIKEKFDRLFFKDVSPQTLIEVIYKPEKDANVEVISKINLGMLLEADNKARALSGSPLNSVNIHSVMNNAATPIAVEVIDFAFLSLSDNVGELRLDDDNYLEVRLSVMNKVALDSYVTTVDGFSNRVARLRTVKKVLYPKNESSKTYDVHGYNFLVVNGQPSELDLKTEDNIVRFDADLFAGFNHETFGLVSFNTDALEAVVGANFAYLIPLHKVKDITISFPASVSDVPFYLMS